ncbi:RNA polymerase sigma factor [Rubricoccus marinus]|uniref:RNA polymerase sigma factor n=1 Tax=Rubricoccus marinus TaxID=716817 RepID=UPI000B9930E4|nr:sigma-70 family RNA polymerase sigma factor [Rubricoccus marinus]
MPTERDLIHGCKQQHPPSQEALYRLYWSFAMSVALRYAASREDALEVAHDAFVKAFGAMGDVDPGRPFKPWFRQILVRCAIDQHRSTRRHYATLAPSDDPPEAPVHADQLGALETGEILQLLAELSEPQRAVFNLYEVEGYSHDEIAGLLGIAVGTSRSHLTRARARLQALYHHHIGTLS